MEKLILKAKHFKGTNYQDNFNCALCKAAKEQFKEEFVSEGVDNIDIGKTYYLHRQYRDGEFDKDKIKAKELKYSNTVLKTINLKKVKISK